MSDLDAKLAEVAHQYDDLQAELARPETSTNPAELRRPGQELAPPPPAAAERRRPARARARRAPAVEAFRRLEATRAELAGARELRGDGAADDELRQMARVEIERLAAGGARGAEGGQGRPL